jgi:beta-glucanase (GH16 family)
VLRPFLLASGGSAVATLTFDDEFNTLSLWNGTTGTWMTSNLGAPLSGNGWSPTGEQEWYINSNYAPTSSVTPWTVNNGILTITAAPASPSIQSLIDGYQYTSGRITNAESFSQTYGYFEMRAQMPAGQGLWPAFWLLDTNGQWPPEMDVIEQLGKDPSVYYTFVHSTNSQLDTGGQPIATSPGYHTYGVDWEASTITFYFDGQKVAQTATPPDLNQPMSMILNLALGGGWAGAVDPSVLPAQMNVDWIRAYSALPSWIADGSDPTDVAHTPASAIGSTGGGTTTGGGGTTTGGGGTTGGGTTSSPVMDAAATYTVPAGVTNVVLTGTSAQTITANNLGDTITSNDHGSTLIGGTGNDTMIAGHGPDMLTGGGGSDSFVFNFAPWSAGHITDFTPGTDTMNLSGVLSAYGYTGTNPVADGWLSFVADGAGNTRVMVNPHDPSWPWSYLITTLDHVAPATITSHDWIFHA